MALPRSGCLALAFLLLGVTPATATIIEGIEFTDLVSIEVPGETNLLLTTSEDVYIYAPNGLIGDTVELIANLMIVIDAPIVADTLSLCDEPTVCPTGEYDLQDDVLLTVLDPVGDFRVEAGGSIILSTTPIPEPSTSALVVLGLVTMLCCKRCKPPRCVLQHDGWSGGGSLVWKPRTNC